MCFIYIHVYYLIYEQNMATGTKCFKRKLIKNMLIPISTDGCFTLGIILVGIQRFHWFLGGKPLWGWLEETLINQRLMGLYKIVVFGFGDFWALFFSSNENGEGNRNRFHEDWERNISCIDSWSCTHTVTHMMCPIPGWWFWVDLNHPPLVYYQWPWEENRMRNRLRGKVIEFFHCQ